MSATTNGTSSNSEIPAGPATGDETLTSPTGTMVRFRRGMESKFDSLMTNPAMTPGKTKKLENVLTTTAASIGPVSAGDTPEIMDKHLPNSAVPSWLKDIYNCIMEETDQKISNLKAKMQMMEQEINKLKEEMEQTIQIDNAQKTRRNKKPDLPVAPQPCKKCGTGVCIEHMFKRK